MNYESEQYIRGVLNRFLTTDGAGSRSDFEWMRNVLNVTQ